MTNDPIQAMRASRSDLIDALKQAGADVSRPANMRCPFHEDKEPSAGIFLGDDGAWRFKCLSAHCGFKGDVFDVLARVTGETVGSQIIAIRKAQGDRPVNGKKSRRFDSIELWEAAIPHRTRTYRYTHPDTGDIDLLKVRIEPPGERKRFLQAHLEHDGSVVESAPPAPHPIYNRRRVRDAEQVVMVEGEKCVEALHKVNVVATCCPGGGGEGSATRADLSPLAGKVVILWPDHDPVNGKGERGGHLHMLEVASELRKLVPAPSLCWLDPERLGLGEKEDAADYLERFPDGGAADAISDALDLATPMAGASSEVGAFIELIIAGKVSNIATPFIGMTRLSRSLLPGAVLILVGDPGTAKSFLVGQHLITWDAQGIPAAAYMLEDDRRFHLQRVLAQLSGDSRLLDSEWIEKHPAEARAAYGKHASQLDAIGAMMWDAPETTLKHKDILAWVRARCESGARVVVVDPITAVDSGEKPWESEKVFMADVKTILRKYGASLILVSHPRDGKNHGSLDQIAGSRVFPRFAQSVWWLKSASGDKNRRVRDFISQQERHVTIDKEITIAKSRNGRGHGAALAFAFNAKTVRFEELGLLLKDDK